MTVGTVLRSRAWKLPMVEKVCKSPELAELTYAELETLVAELVRLRLVMKQAQGPEEFYGTMPTELPKTLPVGTRWSNPTYGVEGEALLELRLKGREYSGVVGYDNGQVASGVLAEHIDWATVVRQDVRVEEEP